MPNQSSLDKNAKANLFNNAGQDESAGKDNLKVIIPVAIVIAIIIALGLIFGNGWIDFVLHNLGFIVIGIVILAVTLIIFFMVKSKNDRKKAGSYFEDHIKKQ